MNFNNLKDSKWNNIQHFRMLKKDKRHKERESRRERAREHHSLWGIFWDEEQRLLRSLSAPLTLARTWIFYDAKPHEELLHISSLYIKAWLKLTYVLIPLAALFTLVALKLTQDRSIANGGSFVFVSVLPLFQGRKYLGRKFGKWHHFTIPVHQTPLIQAFPDVNW